jgi:long-chain acyl-CoA synthetase
MVCAKTTEQVSTDPGVILGYTIPSLLRDACIHTPNAHAFNQWVESGWQAFSNQAFQAAVESVALGLVDLGLEKGDRVALLMHSDINFCIADLGSLLANLVNVPIDLTQTLEHIIFVLQHSEAKVLIVSNLDLLAQLTPYLWNTPHLQHIIVVTVAVNWPEARAQWIAASSKQDHTITKEIPESACLDIPMLLHPALEQPYAAFPSHIQIFSLEEIQQRVLSAEKLELDNSAIDRPAADTSEIDNSETDARLTNKLSPLYNTLKPDDLATIVYIPDEQGQLQGVMLTHENLSANALTSFSVIPGLKQGPEEVVLSFLPLNHVLARTLLYGHISYGHSIYFSNPNRVMKHLKQVQPTILTTVPLLLEKIYSNVLERGDKAFSIVERMLLRWSLNLAKRYELGESPSGLYALQLKLADWLMFGRWRSLFGRRLTYLICGGATLRAELANVFAAAGIPVMHGYGLTQASAVVCCNRGDLNRAGTVGKPIPGAEVAIAEDGEILIRGPYVTPGYYNNPEATQALIDGQGWLHTGDLGTFTEDGFLKISGLKKALFKLSTGKYIVPQPIEQRLKQSPFVTEAIAVGADQKFCAMLIVPNLEALHSYGLEVGLNLSNDNLLKHPCVLALYQALVNMANCHLPYWAIVKRFRLISAAELDHLLPLTKSSNRSQLLQALAKEIDALFAEDTAKNVKATAKNTAPSFANEQIDEALCPTIPVASCPVFAQSLNPRLTTLRSIAPFMLYTGMTMPDVPRRIAQIITIL